MAMTAASVNCCGDGCVVRQNTERKLSGGVVLHFAPEPLGVVGWFRRRRACQGGEPNSGADQCLQLPSMLAAGWLVLSRQPSMEAENIELADSTFPVSRNSHTEIAKMEQDLLCVALLSKSQLEHFDPQSSNFSRSTTLLCHHLHAICRPCSNPSRAEMAVYARQPG